MAANLVPTDSVECVWSNSRGIEECIKGQFDQSIVSVDYIRSVLDLLVG